MAIAIDGSRVPDSLPTMKCGGTPQFDTTSGMSYRCDSCYAVIGSVGQPSRCKTLNAESEAESGC